ncbi:spermatid nuclear transition protein 1 [Nycticebus coucang]|uniref:spermatid nuclear transition protein 1 n=1 Tax=Nycticebus coucang TaxID=9470 RepID=UPI00234D29E6|nr:spermatid nuclear transition protein 1 [Nycticebus coucang]
MTTSRKFKSHGMRRGKNRSPHKGVKRGGSKRKYRKGSLKSRKRGDDVGSALVDLEQHQAAAREQKGDCQGERNRPKPEESLWGRLLRKQRREVVCECKVFLRSQYLKEMGRLQDWPNGSGEAQMTHMWVESKASSHLSRKTAST